MSALKMESIKKMSAKEQSEKIEELRLELVKSGASASKTKMKTKEIKKALARLFTFAQAEKNQRMRTK